MDTITTILVTAFLNLAITTGVFLRVQKNIELSFEKKLEEFKATLQKTLTEHQIKFSTTYPKVLEVLEAVSGRFHMAAIAFSILCHRPSPEEIEEKNQSEDGYKYPREISDLFYSELSECSTYFTIHRRFLDDSTAGEIETILETAEKLGTALHFLLVVFFTSEDKQATALEDWASVIEFPAKINSNGEDVPDKYAEAYKEEMKILLRRMEQLYKSFAFSTR